ncbi:MAG: hypothetical protein M0R03_12280, partial [Novosphingobium sp.]|nr:hypothetical protein [Novosphingobium sp.]
MTDAAPLEPAEPGPAESGPADAPKRRDGWRVRLVKTGVAAVLGLAALAALIVFGLDTGPGHRFVADQIAGLRFENGMRIRVGRIEGSIYGRMRVKGLSLHDPNGEFLYSPEVAIDWRPFAYLRNHVDIRSATAQRMNLRRAPEFAPTPPSEEPLLPDIDIDVGKLSVARLIAEKPVTGKRRDLSLAGAAHIADGRAQITFDGRTIAGQGDGGGDLLKLVLDAVPAKDRLAIDLRVDAPKDGVVAALAGFEAPLAIRATGRGEWKAWNGALDATYDGQELAKLAFTGRDGTFRLHGPTRVSRLATGPTASLLGPVTNVDLTAAWEKRRATLSGSISSDAFALTPNGLVDLSENRFEELKLAFTLLKPSALAPNLSGSGLRGIFTLNGPFATPKVVYALHADRLAMGSGGNDMGINRLTASGEARVDARRIVIPVAARAARITGLDTVAGGSLVNVRLDGDLAVDGTRILSDNMRLRSDRIDARTILVADVSRGFYTGAINGRIDDYRIESVGIFNVSTDMELQSEAQGFAMAGKVRARSTRLLNSGVESFLGGNAVASSDVRYGADGVVRFANLRLEAPLLRVTGGQGSYSPDGGRIVLNANGVSRQYGLLGVQVAGTIASPDAVVTADRPGLGIGLANLRARVTGATGGYRLAATGDTDYGPLTADVILGTSGGTSLAITSANLGGIDFAGSLRQTAAGPFAGEL